VWTVLELRIGNALSEGALPHLGLGYQVKQKDVQHAQQCKVCLTEKNKRMQFLFSQCGSTKIPKRKPLKHDANVEAISDLHGLM
jgi:hypothetical protein